jgi:hypothetical protein
MDKCLLFELCCEKAQVLLLDRWSNIGGGISNMSVLIYVLTKTTGPIVIVTLTAHQTPNLTSHNGPL